MRKTCTKCGIEKDESEFAKNGELGRHTACKQCAKDAAKKWREENPELAKERDRTKHEKYRESRLAKMKEYSKANAAKRSKVEKDRYAKDKDSIKKRNYAYRDANKGKVRAWNNSRRAIEKRATPLWADLNKIAAIYEESISMNANGCEKYHVDHIIPLKGKNVCGLHVHNNLSIIKASENLSKGASHAS